ncbi:hypothetical protein RRG08_008655 [Elysia crispata]|uniref:Uncharacterized protein n=1 Tax=Elysia crispata TaxID=231223 RepID=A0AAE1DU12_9GAST|nr:hypothetical protein RRG08_008655 [Elysia crispata]
MEVMKSVEIEIKTDKYYKEIKRNRNQRVKTNFDALIKQKMETRCVQKFQYIHMLDRWIEQICSNLRSLVSLLQNIKLRGVIFYCKPYSWALEPRMEILLTRWSVVSWLCMQGAKFNSVHVDVVRQCFVPPPHSKLYGDPQEKQEGLD